MIRSPLDVSSEGTKNLTGDVRPGAVHTDGSAGEETVRIDVLDVGDVPPHIVDGADDALCES